MGPPDLPYWYRATLEARVRLDPLCQESLVVVRGTGGCFTPHPDGRWGGSLLVRCRALPTGFRPDPQPFYVPADIWHPDSLNAALDVVAASWSWRGDGFLPGSVWRWESYNLRIDDLAVSRPDAACQDALAGLDPRRDFLSLPSLPSLQAPPPIRPGRVPPPLDPTSLDEVMVAVERAEAALRW